MAIHQPHYLPWLPYFDKADQADMFVYLDNVAYQKNGYQNRNRIKSANGAQWLTVPVHAHLGTPICDVVIADDGWRRRHVESIAQSYSQAACLSIFRHGLQPILEQKWERLIDLNIRVTEWMFEELNIKCRRVRASEMLLSQRKEELVVAICKKLNADTYLSGVGAEGYQDPTYFKRHGVTLRYQSFSWPEYTQCHPGLGFVPDLSAIDLILNHGPRSGDFMRASRVAGRAVER